MQNIYFFHCLLQQLNLKLNIAMKKVSSMLSNNFSKTVESFIRKDEGFNFTIPIKGAPAYWKKLLFEVLTMIK